MTSSELKEILKDIEGLAGKGSVWLELAIGIALVDVLEQIREELITRMPLTGERGIDDV